MELRECRDSSQPTLPVRSSHVPKVPARPVAHHPRHSHPGLAFSAWEEAKGNPVVAQWCGEGTVCEGEIGGWRFFEMLKLRCVIVMRWGGAADAQPKQRLAGARQSRNSKTLNTGRVWKKRTTGKGAFGQGSSNTSLQREKTHSWDFIPSFLGVAHPFTNLKFQNKNKKKHSKNVHII